MCVWAGEATCFAAQLCHGKDSTDQELDQLLTSLDRYLSDNPAPSSQRVGVMLDLCVSLNNDQLMSRCIAANDKCQGALHLLRTRRVRTGIHRTTRSVADALISCD